MFPIPFMASMIFAPSAPVNSVAPSISGSPYVGNTVSANNGAWTGYPVPTFTYEWFIDAVSTGITTSTYVIQAGDDTKTLTVEVTATNGSGSAGATSAGVVVGTQPVNTVAPAVTGTTEVGETLTTDSGTWTGTATITYAYQWKRDGVSIGGAVATTYLLTASDEGALISCTVTATNAYNSASQGSNIVGPVTPAGTGNDLEWGSGNSLEWGSGNTLTWG